MRYCSFFAASFVKFVWQVSRNTFSEPRFTSARNMHTNILATEEETFGKQIQKRFETFVKILWALIELLWEHILGAGLQWLAPSYGVKSDRERRFVDELMRLPKKN